MFIMILQTETLQAGKTELPLRAVSMGFAHAHRLIVKHL